MRGMNGQGLEDSGPTKERTDKGKQGRCGPQVFTGNVLQTEQQCWGMKGDLVSMGGRGQITRGIQSPGIALSSCPDVGRIWVLEGGRSNFKAEKRVTLITTAPLPPCSVPWVIAGEYSSRMPH